MNPPTRPPPKVLFVHNGSPFQAHLNYLATAGLNVSEADADLALERATILQPDIIVLDLDCDGDLIAQLKGESLTEHIPIIALAGLIRR
jgi:CheY-like chemotaxis protein